MTSTILSAILRVVMLTGSGVLLWAAYTAPWQSHAPSPQIHFAKSGPSATVLVDSGGKVLLTTTPPATEELFRIIEQQSETNWKLIKTNEELIGLNRTIEDQRDRALAMVKTCAPGNIEVIGRRHGWNSDQEEQK